MAMQINRTLGEIISLVEGDSTLDPSFLVANIASLEGAGPLDLAVVFNPDEEAIFDPIAKSTVEKSSAGVILAREAIVPGKNYILVSDPLSAFQKIIHQLGGFGALQGAHSTAVVSMSAMLGAHVSVGPYVVIEDDAIIGDGCVLQAHAFIGRGAKLGVHVEVRPSGKVLHRCEVGDHAIIHEGAIVGSDGFGYRITKRGLAKVPHIGIVKVGKYAEIGSHATVDRAAFDATIIGDGAKLDSQTHVAHNSIIGPHTAILAQTAIAGSVRIGAGCLIGSHVVVKDHVTIGNSVKVVSKSGVMRDTEDRAIVAGVPAMPFRQWKRLMVALANFQEILAPVTALKSFMAQQQAKKRWWKFWM